MAQRWRPLARIGDAETRRRILLDESDRLSNPFRLDAPVGVGGANRRADVSLVETALTRTKHLPAGGRPTGFMSSPLADAVRDFQRDRKLKIDGRLDPAGPTVSALANSFGQTAPKPAAVRRPPLAALSSDAVGANGRTVAHLMTTANDGLIPRLIADDVAGKAPLRAKAVDLLAKLRERDPDRAKTMRDKARAFLGEAARALLDDMVDDHATERAEGLRETAERLKRQSEDAPDPGDRDDEDEPPDEPGEPGPNCEAEEDAVEEAEEELENAEKHLELSEDAVSETESDIERTEVGISETEAFIQEEKERIAFKEKEIDRAKFIARNTFDRRHAIMVDEKIRGIRIEIEEIQEEIEQAGEKLKDLRDELKSLKETLIERRETVADAKESLEQAEAALSEAEEALADCEDREE